VPCRALQLEVGENVLVAELKAMISVETGMPVRSQVLTHQIAVLADSQSVYGCRLADMAVLHVKAAQETSNLIAGSLRKPRLAFA